MEKAADHVAKVKAWQRCYLREYLTDIDFNCVELGLSPFSWPWKLVIELAEESNRSRISKEQASAVRAILRWIKKTPQLQKFASLRPFQVNLRNLREFFITSEALAAATTNNRLLRDLPIFRSKVLKFGAGSFAGDLSRSRVGFRTTVRYVSTPRPLISDGTDPLSLKSGHPLGAIPFANFVDLKMKSMKKVEADIERIRDACIADLDLGEQVRNKLIALGSREPEKRVLEKLGTLGPAAKALAESLQRANISPEEALHGIAFEISRRKLYKAGAPSYQVPLLRSVLRELFNPSAPFRAHKSLEMGFRASGEEVFAAMLLLQTYCGWNFSSLMSLPADGLKISGSLVELSGGFKSRTDDDAPPFALEMTSPGVGKAINLLLWNREKLISYGNLPATYERLFVTGPRANSTGMHPISRLKSLIKRYQLPPFSLDQVRTQVLFHVGLRGGVENARRIAGHGHINTTGRYLDQLATRRLNSASNLEFQKRLESQLQYERNPKSAEPGALQLTRIGDGSSCIDPTAPPLGRSVNPNNCLGEHCHTNGGCSNRRIVIDHDRMEEVLRMKTHYEERHHVMRDSNPEHFEKVVVPAIIFNEALHQILERGPHSSTYAKMALLLEK